MSHIYKSALLPLLVVLSGCAGLTGFTGADAGTRMGDWVEFNVSHPGLTVKIIEPFSQDLAPISTVGKTSPSPLRHTVTFGRTTDLHTLEIVGRYHKDVYLDGQFYASLWTGDVVIKEGLISIDGKLLPQIKN
ncbi:hypothetical protein Sden_2621 [Shewanella denitrificans OS217]|uniref:Lipoprotein n=1 Tax=Shewanella denitrificans (strain OS217 / ATCC BAA-1090 / DSM 15013) TaxID=318161 RepID=Q12KX6_SHEDO|nr:hypothetical protein [Shewanella denitrificans]ABE55900.1 hypothetical protein Sden_2621 [Shewanella denitrificans OS217]